MPERVIIIGAGISGAIAAGAISSFSPVVYEAKEEQASLADHAAVMRVRDPNVSMLLGCSAEAIQVHKSVFYSGWMTTSNPEINNLYSLKTTSSLRDASIQDLGFKERYLLGSRDQLKPKALTKYRMKLVSISKGLATFIDGEDFDETIVPYDFCISTIPLPLMLRLTNPLLEEHTFEARSESIFVFTRETKLPSSVHQTVYFPAKEMSSYRATLEGQKLIVEAIRAPEKKEMDFICSLFGLQEEHFTGCWVGIEQKHGKILPCNEDERKRILWKLTEEFGIFSFGRFAIWRPIRTDHLVGDIQWIQKAITSRSLGYQVSKKKEMN
jgi:hypothetical protein